MKIKISNEKLLIIIIYIIFLFAFPLRNTIFNGYLKYFNIPFIILIILIIYVNRYNINYKKTILLFFLIFNFIVSDLIYEATILRFLIYLFMNVLPMFLLCIKWENINIKVEDVRNIIKTYNYFIFLITIMYFFDLITNGFIMRFIANNFVPYVSRWIPTSNQSIIGTRYATFLGQYLETNYIYIVFYLINTYYNSFVNKNDQFCKQRVINIISIIGVLSSGSKVGFVILAISLIIFNLKKIISMVSLIFIFLSAYFIGAFNLILSRIQNEPISTGRFERWDSFLNSNLFHIHLFYGLGDDFSSIIANHLGILVSEITQELPFLILFYKNGIVATIIIVLFLLIFPLLYKGNNLYSRFSIIMIFLIINSYNGYLVNPDTLILYIFSLIVIFLITNTNTKKSNIISGKRCLKNENCNNDMV